MKALSLRQPWADLVIQGKKTLELRTWKVTYRGPVAIHASQTIDEKACQRFGIMSDELSTGVVLGLVNLDGIIELKDDVTFASHQKEHLAGGFFKPPVFGWQFSDPQPLNPPIPIQGRMGLFNIPDKLVVDKSKGRQEVAKAALYSANIPGFSSPIDWDARFSFELRVIPEQASSPALASYHLALYQRLVEPPSIQPSLSASTPSHLKLMVELGGSLLKAVADQILEVLRQNGYQATDLSASRREPFVLTEESGVKLGLLFLAVRPIIKMNRVDAISMGIRAMTNEELYYWYSKCTSSVTAERAQKALRVLLADE